MEKKIRLNPLYVLSEDDKYLYLNRDTTALKIKKEYGNRIVPLLDGTLTEDEIIDKLEGKIDLPNFYYIYNILEKNRAIISLPKESINNPDLIFNSIISNKVRPNTPIKIVFLAESQSLKEIFCQNFIWTGSVTIAEDWENELRQDESIYIVVTPDYLHPELSSFNKVAHQKSINWLPIKIEGTSLLIGPYFTSKFKGCMECIMFRNRMFKNYNKIPSVFSNASINFAISFLNIELSKLTSNSTDDPLLTGVIEYNYEKMEQSYHHFLPNDHCIVCGEKKEKIVTIPKFVSRPKIGYISGGDRIMTATESIKLYKPLISNLTGVIGSLTEADLASNINTYGYYVYHSSYGTTVNDKHKNISNRNAESRKKAIGLSAGKGNTKDQSKMSAIGEAIERYCSQYMGYENDIVASYEELGDKAINPSRLFKFSEKQYQEREKWIKQGKYTFVPYRFEPSEKIGWVKVWSLSDNKALFSPTSYEYYSSKKIPGYKYYPGDSNGVSGGNCLEEAFLQGFYELIERDASGIWWYNMLRKPALNLSKFCDNKMSQLIKEIKKLGYEIYALDLTSDLNIPVIAVFCWHSEKAPLIGLGAHLNVNIALDRALSETIQSFNSNNYWIDLLNKNNISLDYLKPSPTLPMKTPDDYENLATDNLLDDINYILSLLKKHNMDIYIHDLTKREIGYSVVRVIVPELSHFWPRFGTKRLYDTPVKTGELNRPLTEDELNCVGFPF